MKNILLCCLCLALIFTGTAAWAEGDFVSELVAAVESMALNETFAIIPEGDVLSAVRELSRAYDFVGRASTSGRCGYYIGTLKEGAEPPDIFVREDEAGFITEDNQGIHAVFQNGEDIFFEEFKSHAASEDEYTIFLDMKGSRHFLLDAAKRYFEPGGKEWIAHMAERGVSLLPPIDAPHAAVHMKKEDGTFVSEYFLLMAEDMAAFKKQMKMNPKNKREFGIGYSMGGEEYDYTLPEGLFDMAVNRCGYQLVRELPSDIPSRAEMVVIHNREVKMTQVVEDKEALQKIREALFDSKESFASGCEYNARLTLTYEDGRTIVLFRATDSCESFLAGSYVTRQLSKNSAAALDDIFKDAMDLARAGF